MSVSPMDDVGLQSLRDAHVAFTYPDGTLECADCGWPRPCPTQRLLARLDVAEAERAALIRAVADALHVPGSAGSYRANVHRVLTRGFDLKTRLFLGDQSTVERLTDVADSIDRANYPDDEDPGIARRL